MKFGVVVFPGSNCDHDAFYAISDVLHQPVEFIWHQSEDLANCDAVILPGGFAHGDYLRTGAHRAIFSGDEVGGKVCQERRDGSGNLQRLSDFARGGTAAWRGDAQVGFAIYLPPRAYARRSRPTTPFTQAPRNNGQILKIPIAHNDGNYTAMQQTLAELQDNRQILFRYTSADGQR